MAVGSIPDYADADDLMAKTGLSKADAADLIMREWNLDMKAMAENIVLIEQLRQQIAPLKAEIQRLQAINDQISSGATARKKILRDLL